MIKFTLFLLAALVVQNDGAHLARPFLPTPRLDSRIAGGSQTNIEDVPYQLSLQFFGSHICGASIISPTWALTAANCVIGSSNSSEFTLRAGSAARGSGGYIHEAVEVVVHPKYSTSTNDWDFAVIRVGTPFRVGEPRIAAIPMAVGEPREGDEAVISGWGKMKSGGPLQFYLQSATVPVIGRGRCRKILNRYDITERMVCAGLAEGGTGACQGDSGGPLAVNNRLIGVVSWGLGCTNANADSPGVYANVANQRSWIQKVTGV